MHVQDNETATKYLCNDCDKWFMSLETVQRHYETVCGQRFDINDGTCEYCNDVFLSNTGLKMHYYNYHEMKKVRELTEKPNSNKKGLD